MPEALAKLGWRNSHRLMNGSLCRSSKNRKAGMKIAARTDNSSIIGLPNQSLRWPSSSTVISEPSPIAIEMIPGQSPWRRRSRCIGSLRSPYQIVHIMTMPGNKLM